MEYDIKSFFELFFELSQMELAQVLENQFTYNFACANEARVIQMSKSRNASQ